MMKNILWSVLAAMGSLVATAATLEDAITLNPGTTTYTSTDSMWTTTDFTVSLTLDINKFKDALRDSGVSKTGYNLYTFYLREGSNDTAHLAGVKIIQTSNSSTYTTSSVWTTANGTNGWVPSSGSNGNLGGESNYLSTYVDNQWANATGASLTMAYGKETGSYTMLTVYLSDGTYLDYIADNPGIKWSGTGTAGVSSIAIGDGNGLVMDAYLFDSKLSTADIQSITRSLVPEPTTATLSLLALAGLAARRRRK